MAPDDLAIISEKQPNSNKYLSKAVKKEAFEKVSINAQRDVASRATVGDANLRFVDNNKTDFAILNAHAYADGTNEVTLTVKKQTNANAENPRIIMQKGANGQSLLKEMASEIWLRHGNDQTNGRVIVTPSAGRIELYPNSNASHGGYIDFHNNGNDVDYTARIIDSSNSVFIIQVPAEKYIRLQADANKAELVNSPTVSLTNKTSKAIATTGWVASNFLPASDLFDDPTELVNSLAGLLNKKNLCIYVHSSSTLTSSGSFVIKDIPGTNSKGVFLTSSDTAMKPVKTLADAIVIANKVKFLEGASCSIRLLSNIVLTTNSQVISHPDLVQSKAFNIYGWDSGDRFNQTAMTVTGLDGDYTIRQIKYDLKLAQTTYASIISIRCLCSFNYIEFYGGFEAVDFKKPNNEWGLNGYTIGSTCTFLNNHGSDACYINHCRFRGCSICILGSNFNISNCSWVYCSSPLQIRGGINSTISQGLNIYNCTNGFYTEMGGNLTFSTGTRYNFRIASNSPCISNGGGCAVTVNLWNDLTDQALEPDSSGTITIDGETYRRAETIDSPTVVANKNLCGIEMWKIDGWSGNEINQSKRELATTEPTSDGVNQYLNWLLNLETVGGYTDIHHTGYYWIKAMSSNNMGFTLKTIPDVGEIDFL